MITQSAASSMTRRGHDVGLCLIGCSKLKDKGIREACYQRCIKGYLADLFAAISQAAAETGKIPSDFMKPLKTEFDVQLEAASRPEEVRVLTANSACCPR